MNLILYLVFGTYLLLGNCKALINVKIPPITITNAQTAAERQMIGENREIEKDGWLLASIQSSSNGIVSGNKGYDSKFPKSHPAYAHFQRIVYFAPEIKKYKSFGWIGEGLNGILKWNPDNSTWSTKDLDKDKKATIDRILEETNASRQFLVNSELEEKRSKGSNEEELEKTKQSLLDTYQKSTSKGEFWETKPGKWEKRNS